MRRLALVFLILLTCEQSFSQNNYDSVNFQSPLDIPLVLAGNFAELRSNHFHTGIDIKTQGAEGKTVRSIEDGYVSRIKISHWGYGKVLYVTHPNGFTSVYAHLKSFNDKITKYVRKHQYENQTETFDINLPENKILVKQGDKIALSGNTGSSTAPHLHFEIRDTKSENAINPLFFNLDIKDNIKPILNGVKIYALKDGFVKGNQTDIKIPTNGSNGVYTLKRDNIEVDGEIGFAIHAIDKLNGAPNKCGVFNIKLFVDDSLICDQSLRKVDFNQNRYINAYKDYLEYHKNRFHYHRSFLLPNNPLPVYDSIKNSGKIKFNDGKLHKIKYEVYDVYGNKSVVTFNLKHNPNMVKNSSPKKDDRLYNTLRFNSADTIEYDEMKLSFEDSTFYENLSIPISSSKSHLFQSNLYSINQKYVPVHKYFALMINASRVSEKHKSKALIAKINENNIAKPLGGIVEDGYIKANVRELGNFAIILDTIAPKLKSLNLYKNKSITKGYNIIIMATDNLSGINKYQAYIDDKWVLANYKPRKNTITISSEELKKIEKGEHALKLIVEDERKNESSIIINFKLL